MAKMWVTISGANPSDGSSSNTSRGRAISARPDGQHLLLAPGQVAGQRRAALLQARKPPVYLLEVAAERLPTAGVGPGPEVVFDAEVLKDAAAFHHLKDAEPDNVGRIEVGDGLA